MIICIKHNTRYSQRTRSTTFEWESLVSLIGSAKLDISKTSYPSYSNMAQRLSRISRPWQADYGLLVGCSNGTQAPLEEESIYSIQQMSQRRLLIQEQRIET